MFRCLVQLGPRAKLHAASTVSNIRKENVISNMHCIINLLVAKSKECLYQFRVVYEFNVRFYKGVKRINNRYEKADR